DCFLCFFFFFFFQAEDGIRDFHVTGVQTCALPIFMMALSMSVVAAMIGARGLGSIVIQALNTVQIGKGFEGGLAIVIMAVILDRSEERRVGKGSRERR